MHPQTLSVRGPSFPYFGAFESTHIVGAGTDNLETTRHLELWRSDLELLHAGSIRQLRYSVPWHRIERTPGEFDFSWLDGPMRFMRENGMLPVVDPLHHTSFPEWLTGGFANPQFPELYARFIEKVAARYPWIECYTIFNEPLPTTLFCSMAGFWYPYKRCETCFVAMALNVAVAACKAAEAIYGVNPRATLVHVDTCEVHRAVDPQCSDWSGFLNQRRFLFHDLMLGRVDHEHPLFSYLLERGADPLTLGWLTEHPLKIDILGLDYYFHSEMEWSWQEERPQPRSTPQDPVGFAAVAREYVDRFQVPVMLGETNLRGTVADRLTWLKFMQEQCETLAAEADFRGFCWYPSIDSTDWCHLCTRSTGSVDPQGIWHLDEDRWHRNPSELSETYTALAAGRLTSADLPAYELSDGPSKDLPGFLRLMRHWPSWSAQSVR